MSARILKPDAVFNLPVHAVVTLHDVGQSRIYNGYDRVEVGFTMMRFVCLLAEELVVLAAKHIARIGKRRYPLAVRETRVPSDVVHVQVSTKHDVYVVGVESELVKIV